MARILSVVVVVFACISVVVVSAFTISTTLTTNYCHQARQPQRERTVLPITPTCRTITKQSTAAFPTLATVLYEGKESAAELEDRTTSSSSNMLDGVIELGESTEITSTTSETKSTPGLVEQVVAPFFSQGEIDPETLNPDLSDPKQFRVIIYIILSLVPILFLIPLMIGSRDLIPLDAVNPVQL